MKKCLGPCTLPVKSSDYKNIIEAVMATLKGKDKGLEKILTNKMLEASEEENYELAASYRDQILAFKRLKIKQKKSKKNKDLFCF